MTAGLSRTRAKWGDGSLDSCIVLTENLLNKNCWPDNLKTDQELKKTKGGSLHRAAFD
jgi:hypothetical protein